MALKFNDIRGTLFFPVKENNNYKQTTVSSNKKNVFRGIHINDFDKLVTCVQGKILDIIINFNEDSDDYLKPQYYELDPLTNMFQILVPKNHGHAFLTLEEDSMIVYHLASEFTSENTRHIHFLDPYINIILPISETEMILSDKDSIKTFVKKIDYIVLGSSGFLGSHIIEELIIQNKNFIKSNVRLHDISKIESLIHNYSPKYIINCAGITGTPNIFWCDNNKIDTIETNIIFQMTLASLCKKNNIHLTIFGSGGIFNNEGIYSEKDIGNFNGNFYGECRNILEQIVKNYDNILYLRVNYPICHKNCSKNLLTKLLSYKCIESCDISITYVNDLIHILPKMIENYENGICNFISPGYISLKNIIDIYNIFSKKKHEPLVNMLVDNKNNRSFAKLETSMIDKYKPLSINDAITKCVENFIMLD